MKTDTLILAGAAAAALFVIYSYTKKSVGVPATSSSKAYVIDPATLAGSMANVSYSLGSGYKTPYGAADVYGQLGYLGTQQ